MVRSRLIALALAFAMFSIGCTSTTTIYTKPTGAVAKIDGKRTLGRTPIELEEDVWLWTNHMIEVSMEGYGTQNVQIRSDGLNIAYLAVCVCTLGLLLPIMFVSSYPNQYVIELKPTSPDQAAEEPISEQASIDFE